MHVGITSIFDLSPYWSGSRRALIDAERTGDGRLVELVKVEVVMSSGSGSRPWIVLGDWFLELTPTTEPLRGLERKTGLVMSLVVYYRLRNPGETGFAD